VFTSSNTVNAEEEETTAGGCGTEGAGGIAGFGVAVDSSVAAGSNVAVDSSVAVGSDVAVGSGDGVAVGTAVGVGIGVFVGLAVGRGRGVAVAAGATSFETSVMTGTISAVSEVASFAGGGSVQPVTTSAIISSKPT